MVSELTTSINNIYRLTASNRNDRRLDSPHPRTLDKSLPVSLAFRFDYGVPSQLFSLPYDRRCRLKGAPLERVPDEASVRNRALAGLDAARCCHDNHGLGRLDSLCQRGGGKP